MTQPIQRRGFSVAVLSDCFLPAVARVQGMAPLEMYLLFNISAPTLLSLYQALRGFMARALWRPVHLSTVLDWAAFQSRVAKAP